MNNVNPIYYVVYNKSCPILIAPLTKGYGKVSSLTEINGLRNYDFIYKYNENRDVLKKSIDFLIKTINKDLEINYLAFSSPVVDWANEQNNVEISDIKQIVISYGDSIEEYLSCLSKHARQNLRTAYNRLKTDGKKCSLEMYRGPVRDKNLLTKIQKIYNTRRKTKYNNCSQFHAFYLNHFDWLTDEYSKNPDAFNSILKIDGEIAAFMSGFENKSNGVVSIPRLAIDDKYSRYSPGCLLLNETGKKIIDDKSRLKIDLYGSDAPYKVQMGGHIYLKKNITVRNFSTAKRERHI